MTWCWNFINENTFYWVFSTLAQVFGALLALLGVFVVYRIGKFGSELKQYSRPEYEKIGYKIAYALKEMEEEYIRKSVFTLILIASIVMYSIAILPFSYYLINKKLITILLMTASGIMFPIFVLYVIVCFISVSFPKRVVSESMFRWWKFWKH